MIRNVRLFALILALPVVTPHTASGRHFEPHRLSYFLWPYVDDIGGEEDVDFKFQLSVCMSVIDPVHLYVGYTQTSRAFLGEGSIPLIHDFNPEIYFDWEVTQFGVEHESNGIAADGSRSWDRAFAQTRVKGEALGVQLVLEPRLWYAFQESFQTSRILEEHALSGRLGATVRLTGTSRRFLVHLEAGKSHFLGMLGANLIPSWKSWYTTVQYFDGTGDTIYEFDRYTRSAGVGITFVP